MTPLTVKNTSPLKDIRVNCFPMGSSEPNSLLAHDSVIIALFGSLRASSDEPGSNRKSRILNIPASAVDAFAVNSL